MREELNQILDNLSDSWSFAWEWAPAFLYQAPEPFGCQHCRAQRTFSAHDCIFYFATSATETRFDAGELGCVVRIDLVQRMC